MHEYNILLKYMGHTGTMVPVPVLNARVDVWTLDNSTDHTGTGFDTHIYYILHTCMDMVSIKLHSPYLLVGSV